MSFIYIYDKKTKEFIGQAIRFKDPIASERMGEDVFADPENSTVVTPINPKEGYAVVFNEEDKKWEYIEDNRGLIIYNKETNEPLILDMLGTIPNGYSKEKILSISEIRTNKIKEVHNEYLKVRKQKIVIEDVLVNIDDKVRLLDLLPALEIYEEVPFATDEEVILLNKDRVKKLVDTLQERDLSLAKEREKLIKKVKTTKGKNQIQEIRIKF